MIKQLKKSKPKSLAWHKNMCDKKLSLYIRARDRRCVICGRTDNLQNGHYFGRRYLGTRFSFQNCNCQCAGCNIAHNENPEPYRRYMVEKYGQLVLIALENETHKTIKFSRSDYLDIEYEIDRRMKGLDYE